MIFIYINITSGQGQTTAWDPNFYINIKLSSLMSFTVSVLKGNDILTVYPIQ